MLPSTDCYPWDLGAGWDTWALRDTRNSTPQCTSQPACTPSLPVPKPACLAPNQRWSKPPRCLRQLLLPRGGEVGALLWLSEEVEATAARGSEPCCAASLYLQLFCLKIPTGVIFYILQSLPQAVYLALKWSYIFNCWQSIIIRHKSAASALCGSAESSMNLPHLADRQGWIIQLFCSQCTSYNVSSPNQAYCRDPHLREKPAWKLLSSPIIPLRGEGVLWGGRLHGSTGHSLPVQQNVSPLTRKIWPVAPQLGTSGSPSQGTMARAQTEDLSPRHGVAKKLPEMSVDSWAHWNGDIYFPPLVWTSHRCANCGEITG